MELQTRARQSRLFSLLTGESRLLGLMKMCALSRYDSVSHNRKQGFPTTMAHHLYLSRISTLQEAHFLCDEIL